MHFQNGQKGEASSDCFLYFGRVLQGALRVRRSSKDWNEGQLIHWSALDITPLAVHCMRKNIWYGLDWRYQNIISICPSSSVPPLPEFVPCTCSCEIYPIINLFFFVGFTGRASSCQASARKYGYKSDSLTPC